MLSFEMSSTDSLAIYFDAAGRDLLIEALAEMTEPGDHYHLFGPRYGGTELSDEVHRADHRAVQQVSLGIPGQGLQRAPELP